MILARVILSWFPRARSNPLVQLLYTVTEPILGPIRSLLQKSPLGGPGMILDFSPIIAFLFIQLAQSLLLNLIRSI
jgi:YggT family protein